MVQHMKDLMPIVVTNKIKVKYAFNEHCTSDKKFFGIRINGEIYYFIIEDEIKVNHAICDCKKDYGVHKEHGEIICNKCGEIVKE